MNTIEEILAAKIGPHFLLRVFQVGDIIQISISVSVLYQLRRQVSMMNRGQFEKAEKVFRHHGGVLRMILSYFRSGIPRDHHSSSS